MLDEASNKLPGWVSSPFLFLQPHHGPATWRCNSHSQCHEDSNEQLKRVELGRAGDECAPGDPWSRLEAFLVVALGGGATASGG